MILEVHFPSRLLKIQYPNGNIEEEVSFDDIRQMETIHIEYPKEISVNKVKAFSPRNPISLSTYLKIQASLEVESHIWLVSHRD
jgi:hypothetical protein